MYAIKYNLLAKIDLITDFKSKRDPDLWGWLSTYKTCFIVDLFSFYIYLFISYFI
jgi:hypothetical protein